MAYGYVYYHQKSRGNGTKVSLYCRMDESERLCYYIACQVELFVTDGNVGHHRGAESITLERASVQRPTVWALQLHIGAVERPFLLF